MSGTTGSLPPISVASISIGFISFAFTLATFLNVFWSSLLTIYAAPKQINDYLSTLKQGLYEERAHLRRVRRRRKSTRKSLSRNRSRGRESQEPIRTRSTGRAKGGMHHHVERDLENWAGANTGPLGDENDSSLRIMRTVIRDMIRDFRRLERPFLKPKDQDRGELKERAYWDEDEDQWPDYNHTEYKQCGLRERWIWLRRKQDVVGLMEGLARLETRRIAKDVGELSMFVRDIGRDVEDLQDSVYGLEQRLARVVGVRRVD